MDSNLEDAVASISQSRNRLENREVKMMRCLEECGKQWRPVQGKSGWEKQKEEEVRKKAERKQEEKNKKNKQKKKKQWKLRK